MANGGNGGVPVLAARELVKTYPKAAAPALNGLDVLLHSGEAFGLLGPNGAGKTTAISIISTTVLPDKGTVHIRGMDALTEPKLARKHLGLVPQGIALYPNLTIRENLAYFGECYGLGGDRLAQRVAACMETTGLAASADQRAARCSGGIRRRANLAAGLLHEPELLILDEPTVGIDVQTRDMIIEKLIGLRRTRTAILYTTHYMEEAERLCTTVAVMDQGRIIAQGAPADLLRQVPGSKNLGDVYLRLTGKRLRD